MLRNSIGMKSNHLIDDYNRFQDLICRKDIAIDRKDWQPMVMLEKHYPRKQLMDLMSKLQQLEPHVNTAVEVKSYKRYIDDFRYLNGSLPQIILHNYNPSLIVFYPRSYNAKSLTKDLIALGKPYTMPDKVRDAVMHSFQSVFQRMWPDYYMKFIPHGSQVTGLAFHNSALNITIEMDDPDLHRLVEDDSPTIYHYNEPHHTRTITKAFERQGATKFQEDMFTGSIRMKLETSHTVEFNFNKEVYTESSNLIAMYMTLDPRVELFLHALKVYGRGRNLLQWQNNSHMRYYGYTIMALAYLTQLDPPVIPNLQHNNDGSLDDDCFVPHCSSKRKYWDTVISQGSEIGIAARYHDCIDYDSSQPETRYHTAPNKSSTGFYWHSSNTASVGELFIDFFHYYGYRFDYQAHAISLKFGGKTPKKSIWRDNCLAIEDPFMAEVNLGAPIKDINKTRNVFKGSFSVLHSGIAFEVLYKKIADIDRYNSLKGIEGNRPIYKPLPSWNKGTSTCKSFILVGLKDLYDDPSNCYCELIERLFNAHGTVLHMLDLDNTTKQVFLTSGTNNTKDVMLPFKFTLDGRDVHLVELYDFTPPPAARLT